MSTPQTPPTPENVAEYLTSSDAVYREGNWLPSVKAEGNVVAIRVIPLTADDEELPSVHFRAVVVEGEERPIVLPSGAAADYINGDSGYHWLTCGTCEVSLMEVTAGTSVGEMATTIAAHKCAQAANGGEPR